MRMPLTARRRGTPEAGPGTAAASTAAASSPGPGRTAPLRQHWLLALLLLAGLGLRVLATIGYLPALLYIDSLKYLFGAWPGNDPLGYNVILKALLAPGNLTVVAAAQHLLGLAMGVALYALLLRRGVPRWLAALAAAPVLLDAYQVQIEQMIMPDVWFEAFIVAGLVLLAWRPRPGLAAVAAGGVLLGLSAPVAQVGQILIVPALVYVLVVAAGWRRKLLAGAVLCAAFALPIVGFSAREYAVSRPFSLAPAAGSTIYGRLAYSADCATLRLPRAERGLCPAPALARRLGPDGLVHDAASPDHTYAAPPGLPRATAAADFEHAVLAQQPLRVAGSVLRDAAKLFAPARRTSPGDTPISRWQFQTGYPVFGNAIYLRGQTIMLGLHYASSGGTVVYRPLPAALGGPARVSRPLAGFLRGYQQHGGYTPGPLLALTALAGLLGTLALAAGRRLAPARRQTALACLLFFGAAAAVLLASDAFEFSWRYQLPALVTLPPAGALGLAVLAVRRRAAPG
jgi:hypothetical protein